VIAVTRERLRAWATRPPLAHVARRSRAVILAGSRRDRFVSHAGRATAAIEGSSMSKHDARRGKKGRSPANSSEVEAHGAGHRHARLSQILHEELRALMRDELTDPRLDGVVFTAVELSVDYKNARVRFLGPQRGRHTRDDRERFERALARAAPFLRAHLADAVDVKQVPALRFVWDQDAAERPEEWPVDDGR
jgi:ribosome-binding factor A